MRSFHSFYRAMHYSAKRGIAIACRPSVTLVDQEHTDWKSWKIIARTISPIRSLFVAQRPSTYALFFPKSGCSQPPPKTAIAIISGTAKATNFKFGRCIESVHANKSPLKFGRKGSVGVSRDLPIFWVPPIISGMRKATNFKFGRYIQRVHPSKRPLKIYEKRERGHIQGLPKFFQYPLLSQERVKLRTSTLAGIVTGSIRRKAL